MKLTRLAENIGATIHNPNNKNIDDIEIKKISPIDQAEKFDLTFISRSEYVKYLNSTKASAIILKEPNQKCDLIQLIHHHPQLAYAKASNLFYNPDFGQYHIDDKAIICSTAKISKNVVIHPNVIVSKGCVIEEGAVLFPGIFLGKNVKVGKNSIIYSNAVIYDDTVIKNEVIIHGGSVIGADGFGYVGDGKELVKIPQSGNVVIEDSVEIGALCTVDRGALGSTIIGKNSKLDSKVHVGHNVVIGENSVFSAHTALAGSTKVGNWVQCGGHAGIAGHLEVCDYVNIGAMTGVIKSIKEPGTYLGFPAVDATSFHRRQVHFKRFSEQSKKIKMLEEKINSLEKLITNKSK